MKLILKGGRVIDPANQIDGIHDLYVDQGKIAAINHPPERFHPDQVLELAGLTVIPGIVDLCARAREPGEEHKATIASESAAAVSGGITSLVYPPDTNPVVDTPAMARLIQDRAQDSGLAKVLPLGALTIDLEGEKLTDMAMLMDAGCIGMSNAGKPINNTLVLRRAMQYASTYDLTVFLTPKDPWLQGNGCVHEGETSTRLGLPAIPEAAETVGVARDLALIETSGVRAHFDLISCRRSLEMISEARQRGLPVTCSTPIHQLHLSEQDVTVFDAHYKVMPPFRSESDKEALIEGIEAGQISAICSDHQPHSADAKLTPFSEAAIGIAGLDTLLSLTLDLVEQKKLSLSKAIAALTTNPANIAGIDSGHLGVGAIADICIYDSEETWTLNETTMISKGRNSPFLNKTFKGKVRTTLVNGNIAFQRP